MLIDPAMETRSLGRNSHRLASENVQARGDMVVMLLKVAALGVSAAFAVMDFSMSGHWVRLRARANEIAAAIGYRLLARPSRSVHPSSLILSPSWARRWLK